MEKSENSSRDSHFYLPVFHLFKIFLSVVSPNCSCVVLAYLLMYCGVFAVLSLHYLLPTLLFSYRSYYF